ncbi:MAG: aldo/keto reductase [Candidatus Eisenbacteria bacterium]|nr:aldo/keto reductase [Candidatus Eisenbacteria bacterium]
MEYLHLGRTGLLVSRLCLGTMNFGPETPEPDAHRILDRALDEGINFLDTANVYGRQVGEGITEQILGRWFAQGAGRREKVVLATKVYGRMGEGPNERRLSAYHIRRACEESLRRMRTDRIDLYQMHHVDRETPWEEIWQAMEVLIRDGKVLYVGTSNFAAWQIVRGQAVAQKRHLLGLVSEQSLYNLRARTIELEVIPACRALGIALLPWSPLAGGLLAGVLDRPETGRRASTGIQKGIEKHLEQLEQYENLCREMGESPANLALAWVLARPGVTAPIVGPRTLAQLEDAMRALEIRIEDPIAKRLEEIWPGPGGEAPEAYAW